MSLYLAILVLEYIGIHNIRDTYKLTQPVVNYRNFILIISQYCFVLNHYPYKYNANHEVCFKNISRKQL